MTSADRRGSVTPLVAAIVALSMASTLGVVRVARVHLDGELARHGADLVALSVAAGASADIAAEVARLNGTRLVSIDRGGGVVTARVSRGRATMSASAMAASLG